MSAETYAAKKAAGLCQTPSCRKQATEGTLCKRHRKMNRAYTRRARNLDYAFRKAHGLCVLRYKGCAGSARESAGYCEPCGERKNARGREHWRTDPELRAASALQVREWRRKRKGRWLCMTCPMRREKGSPFCDECQEDRRQRDARRTGRVTVAPRRKEEAPVTLEDLATSRIHWEAA